MSEGSPSSNHSQAFEAFSRAREELNRSLDESRREVDTWLEQQRIPAPITALAHFEVLLKNRRDLLERLIALDDEFMVLLIQMRAQPGPRD